MTGAQLAQRARESGLEWLTEEQLAVLRAWLGDLPVAARVRAVHPYGDRLAEFAEDDLWRTLDRKPTREEYLELASVFREAVKFIEQTAARLPSD